MNWDKVKTIIIIVLLILISEGIRLYAGIPITIIDIAILPITCVLIYFIKFYPSLFSKSNNSINTQVSLNAWQLIGLILFAFMLTTMGIWVAWTGILQPLNLFSSIKGGAHGYTLIQLGIITALYSVGFCIVFIYKLIQLHHKSA